MTREGREFVVVDVKTGEDITHNVLTQIIMEEEQRGKNMLPVNFLRQLIAMYGASMQYMVPQYLEASMDASIGRASCRERVCSTCRYRWSPYNTKKKKVAANE